MTNLSSESSAFTLDFEMQHPRAARERRLGENPKTRPR